MFNKLNQEWTFWYDKVDSNISSNKWDQFLIKVNSFSTVENFWRLFNNMLSISNLPLGSNYHVFKTGIEPKWEDIRNLGGGKWVLSNLKNQNSNIDKIWGKTLSALVTETFPQFGLNGVNGIVGSVRKNEIKLALWTDQACNQHNQFFIGKYWKTIIEEELNSKNFVLEYFPHDEKK